MAQLESEVLQRQGSTMQGKVKMRLVTGTCLTLTLLGEEHRPATRSASDLYTVALADFVGSSLGKQLSGLWNFLMRLSIPFAELTRQSLAG